MQVFDKPAATEIPKQRERNLLVIHLDYLHVEAVDGGEDVSGALHHDLPVLGHGERRAPGHEHRLVPRAQRQLAGTYKCKRRFAKV